MKVLTTVTCNYVYQVEAQLDYGPGSEIRVGWKIGVTWSRKRGFKMAASDTVRTRIFTHKNHHFGLVYDMIYQFLGMEAKNYKFGMFGQQCHPSVASGDADIRPRNASRIHICHLFRRNFVKIQDFYCINSISPIWRIWETNPSTKTFKILLSIVMPTFGKSCRRPWLHGLKNQS